MSSLLDALDRFNYTSSSIRSLTLSNPPCTDPGHFTAAILQHSLHDLLREADDAEYGLFTFVKEPSDAPLEGLPPQGKVGRREFRGATPLKPKRVAGTNKEEEPEVYVKAALKYLDRFHAVKPMPHAQTHLESLIDRLNHVRDNLDRLQASLEETAQTGQISPEAQAVEQERRISELKSRILQLRKRKAALASKLPASSKSHSRGPKPTARLAQVKSKIPSPPSTFDSTTSTPSTPIVQPSNTKPKSKPNSRIPPTAYSHSHALSRPPGNSIPPDVTHTTPSPAATRGDPEKSERLFWSGGKPPRILDKSDSLLDEELDMSGMNALMSPPPMSRSRNVPITTDDNANDYGEKPSARETSDDEGRDEDDNEDSDSGEPTIVVSKLPPPATAVTTPPSPPPSRPTSQASVSLVPGPQTPIQGGENGSDAVVPPSTKTKIRRVRVTAELERICAKIWSTIPDLLVPGNNFSSPGKRPPNAKDTLTVLQTIAAQPVPDPTSNIPSPSTHSTLSSLLGIETLGPVGGSPHQIMTAQVLLSLLTAPNYGMPLTALKALLASKTVVPSPGPNAGREAKQSAAAMGASAAQTGTRALYGCVAKKLVKIDRGGGEQIVKFD